VGLLQKSDGHNVVLLGWDNKKLEITVGGKERALWKMRVAKKLLKRRNWAQTVEVDGNRKYSKIRPPSARQAVWVKGSR